MACRRSGIPRRDIFGKSDEEKKQAAMQKKLGQKDRLNVYNSISEEWENIQENIRQSIYKSISRNKAIRQSVSQTTFQLLQGYKESLKRHEF